MHQLVILVFFFTLISISVTSRIEAYLKTLSFQGLLLFMLIMIDSSGLHWINLSFLVVETLVVKAILIPYFLYYVMQRTRIKRDVGPQVVHFYPIVINSIITLFGFFVIYWSIKINHLDKAFFFGAAVSTIITSFFIILQRKKIITHVIGFIVLENGRFLLSLAYLKEMPVFVNIGMLMDIFIAVFLFGLFVNKISDELEEHDIDTLATLKD